MFGKRLKDAREAANLTQEALGEMLGTSARQVWRWETGETEPKGEVVAQIAKALNVSTDYLLNVNNSLKESDLSPLERRVLEAWRKRDFKAIILLTPDESDDK